MYGYEFYSVTIEEQNANAARIVECINALAGIDNPSQFVADMKLAMRTAVKLIEKNEKQTKAFDEYKYNVEQAMRLAIESSDKEASIKNEAIHFLEKLAPHLALITEGDYLIQGIQTFLKQHKST